MRTVLDLQAQRQIRIIEVLTEAHTWVTTGNLASILEVSPKTIADDIKVIKENWGDELNFESSFVYGVRIQRVSTSILLDIFSDLFNRSINVKWVELLFYCPYKDLGYYADKLHVSQSTLYRLFPKINNFFNKYEIKLERSQSIYFF